MLLPASRITPLTLLGMVIVSAASAQPPSIPPLVLSASDVDPVLRETVQPHQDFVGTAQPLRRSVIGTAVDGRVELYQIEAGQEVQEGEQLAQLLTGTIEIEVRGAEAEERLRLRELEELQNGARPEEIARAEAQLAAAKAAEAYSNAKMERIAELARTGSAVSRDEIDRAVSEQQTSTQGRIEAEENLKLLRAGARVEQIAQAEARHEAQAEHVRLLKDRQSKYHIRSPFHGYVVREYTEKGAWVKQGDPIAEVVDLSSVEIEVQVPERSINDVTIGDEVPVNVEAFRQRVTLEVDAPTTRPFVGRVAAIIPEADERTRTFPVRIVVSNEDDPAGRQIRAGMLAWVTLPSGPLLQEAITVHKDSLVNRGEAASIWVVRDGKAAPVPVTLLVEIGSRAVVRGDLQPGDVAVIRGNERLRPGQPVVIKPAETASTGAPNAK